VKIKYLGGSPVDIATVDGVQPGDVVDVADEIAAGLLFAGSEVADDGTITPPAAPLWATATTAAKAAKEA
jgi:hypothetical protein